MLVAIKQHCVAVTQSGFELSIEERNLLSVAVKNSVYARRTSLSKLNQLIVDPVGAVEQQKHGNVFENYRKAIIEGTIM